MRYRVKDYRITIGGGNVYVHIKVPNEDFIVANPVKEAIRLIVDETAKVVFCSSMQKDSIVSVASSSVSGYDVAIGFAIPDGKTIASTDLFTIEMDWGDTVGDYIPSDYAKQSNVGTSSDQASESGSSLFAVLKAVWNKVVNIYNALTDGTNGLSAIKSAIPSVSGLATESSVKDGTDTAIGLLKDQTNGLTAIKNSAASAASDAAAAKTAAQSIIAVDADILAGKQALATNISAMGVPSTVADAMTVMATKVLQIPQQVNTGVSEFEQMITPSPYMWNVYAVANDLMKQTLPAYIPSYMAGGNYAQYRANNAFFVGEYYLGYASLELEGADGYLTCDGDFYTITGEVGSRIVTHTAPDGTVETYAAESVIHTWHDGESGRINRWVAFFYLTNAYSYTNIKSWLCPRRVATCGDCLLFSVSGENRLTEVWNIGTIRSFYGGTDGDSWSNTQAIRIDSVNNVAFTDPKYIQFLVAQFTSISSSVIEFKNTIESTLYSMAIICDEITGGSVIYVNNAAGGFVRPLKDLQYVYITAVSLSGNSTVLNSKKYQPGGIDCKIINAPYLEEIESGSAIVRETIYGAGTNESSNNEVINIPSLTRCLGNIWEKSQYQYGRCANTIDVIVGAMETNLYCRFWNPSNVLSDADKTATLIDNIKNHILARVSDATGGTQLVFTISTNMYNAIASETITWQDQTMTLADAFLTKNWLLAGA